MKKETLHNHILHIQNYLSLAVLYNKDKDVSEQLEKLQDEIIIMKLKYKI